MSKFLILVMLLVAILQPSGSTPVRNYNVTTQENMTKLSRLNHMEQGGHFQGDILNSKEELERMFLPGNGIRDESYRWPDQTLIYQINRPLSTNQKQNLTLAIKQITSKTCIKFKRRTNQKDYVSILDPGYNGGCSSFVGKQGGVQAINFEDRCFKAIGVIAHEFIHALGFDHEQSRTDRDDWVTINWENIESKDLYPNFEKLDAAAITSYGFSYDYGSVMHYGAYDFSKDEKRLKTITTKVAGKAIGQRNGPSQTDVAKIKAMYKCK